MHGIKTNTLSGCLYRHGFLRQHFGLKYVKKSGNPFLIFIPELKGQSSPPQYQNESVKTAHTFVHKLWTK